MSTLVRTPFGRVVLHILVSLDNLNHFRNPHFEFAYAGVVRYVRGIG